MERTILYSTSYLKMLNFELEPHAWTTRKLQVSVGLSIQITSMLMCLIVHLCRYGFATSSGGSILRAKIFVAVGSFIFARSCTCHSHFFMPRNGPEQAPRRLSACTVGPTTAKQRSRWVYELLWRVYTCIGDEPCCPKDLENILCLCDHIDCFIYDCRIEKWRWPKPSSHHAYLSLN